MEAIWNQALALQQIHVLFVDHDYIHDAFIKDMFAYFSCEVTIVRLASEALSILSNGNCQFDLVLENIESPDSYGIQLLYCATAIGLPVMLLTDANDPLTVVMAMESGAVFCIQKPVTLEFVKYPWQYVVREKVYKIRENERLQALVENYQRQNIGTKQEPNNVQQVNVEESLKSVTNRRTWRNQNNDECSSNLPHQSAQRLGKHNWVEWTPELHGRFINAVMTLGEGRCYPKEILELMNVPGLRRMQVASHLQKCRSGTCSYIAGEDRDPDYNGASQNPEITPTRPRRFGIMPRIADNYHDKSVVQENIVDPLSVDHTNVQENKVANLVEDTNTVNLSTWNEIQGQNSEVHINLVESIGHTPFGNVELEEGNGVDVSSGMNTNTTPIQEIDFGELFKDLDLDG